MLVAVYLLYILAVFFQPLILGEMYFTLQYFEFDCSMSFWPQSYILLLPSFSSICSYSALPCTVSMTVSWPWSLESPEWMLKVTVSEMFQVCVSVTHRRSFLHTMCVQYNHSYPNLSILFLMPIKVSANSISSLGPPLYCIILLTPKIFLILYVMSHLCFVSTDDIPQPFINFKLQNNHSEFSLHFMYFSFKCLITLIRILERKFRKQYMLLCITCFLNNCP